MRIKMLRLLLNSILLTLMMTLIVLFAACNNFNNDLNDYLDSNLGVATVREVLPPKDGVVVPETGDISIAEHDAVITLKLDNPHNLALIPRLLGSEDPARFTLNQTEGDTFLLGISDVIFGERFILTLELYVENRPDFYSTNKLPDIVCIKELEVSVDPDYPVTLDADRIPQANWVMNYKTNPIISYVTFKFQREGKEETITEMYKWDKSNNRLLDVPEERYDPKYPLSISFPDVFGPVEAGVSVDYTTLKGVYRFMVTAIDEMETEKGDASPNFLEPPLYPSDLNITVEILGFQSFQFLVSQPLTAKRGDTISLEISSTALFPCWRVKMSGGKYSYPFSSNSVTTTFTFTLPSNTEFGTYTVQVFAYNDPLDVYSGNFMLTVVE